VLRRAIQTTSGRLILLLAAISIFEPERAAALERQLSGGG
jgi:hypothetical protein